MTENNVIDGLIDVSELMEEVPCEKSEIQETGPEPESMLDCVFEDSETPEEEYTRALKVCEPHYEFIKAYGTTLTVKEFNEKPYADGDIELTFKENAALCMWETVSIRIRRCWNRNEEDGKVEVKDYYFLTLYHHSVKVISYDTDCKKSTLPQALESLLQMRDCIRDNRTFQERFPTAKYWER